MVTFGNGTAFNDFFEGFTYGSKLSFHASLFGPALSSPDGTATSGSTFAFSMFSDAPARCLFSRPTRPRDLPLRST